VNTPIETMLAALEAHGCTISSEGDGWRTPCPSPLHTHGNRKSPALTITEGTNGAVLMTCHAGCEPDIVVKAVGLELKDLFPQSDYRPEKRPAKVLKVYASPPDGLDGVSRFTYTDASKQSVIYVTRQDTQGGKRIRQWGKSDCGSGWICSLRNAPKPRPFYRLPAILQADGVVCIHEGEKAVVAACKARLHGIHTTAIGGAGNAKHTDFTPLKGRDVCVIPDIDEPGEKHAQQVAALATAAGAQSVKIVRLPGLPEKGDVVEWLESGGNIESWMQLLSDARQIKQAPGACDSQAWPKPLPLPDAMLPVMPFDIDLLPRAFRAYVQDVVEGMQCPVEYVAAAIMAAFGGVIGASCTIYPKQHDTGWKSVPNLWACLVGSPSMMKSPAMSAAMVGVNGLIADARKKHADDLAAFEIQQKIHKAQDKALDAEIAKLVKTGKATDSLTLPERPEPPIERRYITNAGSVERLISLLEQNPDGIIQSRDELAGWIRSMDKAASQDARAFYLEAWDGTAASFSYDTVAHGHMFLEPGPCVSVMGTIQPGVLASMIADANNGGAGDDGLLQRFQLMVLPDNALGWKYTDRPTDQFLTDRVKDAFKVASSLSGVLKFAPDAQPVFIEWYSDLVHRSRAESNPAIEAHLFKYGSLMPAIALLIHLADFASQPDYEREQYVELPPVPEDAARKAVAWCGWLEAHARRIYALGANAGVDAAKRLLERVIDGRLPYTFTPRDVYRKAWGGLNTIDKVKQAVDLLELYGWAKVEIEQTGGRPSMKCTIHPESKKYEICVSTPLTKPTKGLLTPFVSTRQTHMKKKNHEIVKTTGATGAAGAQPYAATDKPRPPQQGQQGRTGAGKSTAPTAPTAPTTTGAAENVANKGRAPTAHHAHHKNSNLIKPEVKDDGRVRLSI